MSNNTQRHTANAQYFLFPGSLTLYDEIDKVGYEWSWSV